MKTNVLIILIHKPKWFDLKPDKQKHNRMENLIFFMFVACLKMLASEDNMVHQETTMFLVSWAFK